MRAGGATGLLLQFRCGDCGCVLSGDQNDGREGAEGRVLQAEGTVDAKAVRLGVTCVPEVAACSLNPRRRGPHCAQGRQPP